MSTPPAVEGIMRIAEVRHVTGLSRPTIYRRIKSKRFPAQLDLEGGLVGWSRAEVHAWIANRPRREAPG